MGACGVAGPRLATAGPTLLRQAIKPNAQAALSDSLKLPERCDAGSPMAARMRCRIGSHYLGVEASFGILRMLWKAPELLPDR